MENVKGRLKQAPILIRAGQDETNDSLSLTPSVIPSRTYLAVGQLGVGDLAGLRAHPCGVEDVERVDIPANVKKSAE